MTIKFTQHPENYENFMLQLTKVKGKVSTDTVYLSIIEDDMLKESGSVTMVRLNLKSPTVYKADWHPFSSSYLFVLNKNMGL